MYNRALWRVNTDLQQHSKQITGEQAWSLYIHTSIKSFASTHAHPHSYCVGLAKGIYLLFNIFEGCFMILLTCY